MAYLGKQFISFFILLLFSFLFLSTQAINPRYFSQQVRLQNNDAPKAYKINKELQKQNNQEPSFSKEDDEPYGLENKHDSPPPPPSPYRPFNYNPYAYRTNAETDNEPAYGNKADEFGNKQATLSENYGSNQLKSPATTVAEKYEKNNNDGGYHFYKKKTNSDDDKDVSGKEEPEDFSEEELDEEEPSNTKTWAQNYPTSSNQRQDNQFYYKDNEHTPQKYGKQNSYDKKGNYFADNDEELNEMLDEENNSPQEYKYTQTFTPPPTKYSNQDKNMYGETQYSNQKKNSPYGEVQGMSDTRLAGTYYHVGSEKFVDTKPNHNKYQSDFAGDTWKYHQHYTQDSEQSNP